MEIFKVKSNVFNEKIGEILHKLSGEYSLLFLEETLFISPNNYNQEINFKKALRPQRDFLVSELSDSDIAKECEVVKDWCKERLVQLDIQRFEAEQQEYLKGLLDYLDKLDSSLEKEEQKGDET